MDVMEAIQKRRSIRKYRPDNIPEDVLERLLNALRLAPSGGNAQPWKFIVVRDKGVKLEVVAACTWYAADGRRVAQDWIEEAPVVIVACGSEKDAAVRYYKNGKSVIARWDGLTAEMAQGPVEYESVLLWDLTIAVDHLTLAATAEGLGTCWIGGLDEQHLRKVLSIPDDVRAPFAVVVGYPVSWPEPRSRKSLDDIICYDRYS